MKTRMKNLMLIISMFVSSATFAQLGLGVTSMNRVTGSAAFHRPALDVPVNFTRNTTDATRKNAVAKTRRIKNRSKRVSSSAAENAKAATKEPSEQGKLTASTALETTSHLQPEAKGNGENALDNVHDRLNNLGDKMDERKPDGKNGNTGLDAASNAVSSAAANVQESGKKEDGNRRNKDRKKSGTKISAKSQTNPSANSSASVKKEKGNASVQSDTKISAKSTSSVDMH